MEIVFRTEKIILHEIVVDKKVLNVIEQFYVDKIKHRWYNVI